MKLYAPKYYNYFKCIADKCRHSCCIGWEIDVDDSTMKKYQNLDHPYAEQIINSIVNSRFNMCADGRCPHLDGSGLCRIISELGDGYLCDICREHPRFYNVTPYGIEVGIGIACDEACRLILECEKYYEIEAVGEAFMDSESEYDIRDFRNHIYTTLSDHSLRYSERLEKIYREFDVYPALLSDDHWREILGTLEYLDNSHKYLFSSSYTSEVTDNPDLDIYLERVLAYLLYRHLSDVDNEFELRAAIGFSLFCERLIASIANANNIAEVCRIVSEEIEYSEENTEAIKFEFYI